MKRDERQVWCSHSDLPQVLSGLRSLSKHLASPIDELILENNYLPSLPARTFDNLKVLRIMLRQNGLERVSPDWLHGLEDLLMELFVVEPKLRYLPDDSLSRMNALEAITIQTNDLKRLPQISSLRKLRYVQVESVALAELSPRNFKDLPALEKFQISGSKKLRRLEAGLFENLPVLKSINMSHCGVFWIHPRALVDLPELKELSLIHNEIVDAGMVGRACKDLHSLRDLHLDHNRIGVLAKGSFVDLPSLQYLHLSYNNISEIQQGAFHRVPRLKNLQLNNNVLTRIHPQSFIQSSDIALEELWMIDNHVSHISELRSLLDALPRLIYLDMSSNLLETIPFGLLGGHPTLEVLKLNGNKLRYIDMESFMAMPALRELSLRNNFLSNNNQGPLWNLPSLKGLDLSRNKFRRIETKFLANLPSLRRIDVSDNELVAVDQNAFTVTPLIEYVNLSHNNLQFIHPVTFKYSVKLYELDLSQNRLEEFMVDLSEGLEYLHLKLNKLRALPSLSRTTKLYSLKYLDLSYNLIGKLNPLNLKKLPSLKKFYLANNFIQRLEGGVLEGLPKLELLDLKANKIVSLHQDSLRNLNNLIELNLRNNFIETLFTATLQKASKLSRLDVSGNKLVDFLQGNSGFNSNLKHLNISNNFLINMPANIFRMKKLMVLDLSHNRIKHLPVEAFSKLEDLVDLRVSDNFIRELRLSTFSRLRNLKIVYLDRNDIDKIETNTFQSLPSLEMIKLDNNKLSSVPSYTFNNLTMLQVAELQSNNLENLASDAFNLVPNLLFLNLSGNNIRRVEESGLRNVPSLEVLDLSDNAIRRIDSDGLKHMKWLVELKLDENRICEIVGAPFSDMPRLRVISLRRNKLRKVSEKVLDKIRTNIAVFDVDGNPLFCDCNVLWLKVWAEESSTMGPHCSGGSLVRELKLSPSYCKQKPPRDVPNDCEETSNRFSQVPSKYPNLRNISTEHKTNVLAPLPQESEYFYDEYVDYPFNESLSLVSNEEVGVLDRFLRLNHSSLMEHEVSSHVIPGDTPTLYAAPSKNRTKPDIPKEVPHSPSSSGFTFFGVPLPSINFGQLLGGNKDNAAKSDHTMKSLVPVADRKVAIMNVPVMRATTARNFYRLPPSTPFIETGGFRPILPGEGGFRPIFETTTLETDGRRTEITTKVWTSTEKPEDVTWTRTGTQERPRDSSNSASAQVVQKTSSTTDAFEQEIATYTTEMELVTATDKLTTTVRNDEFVVVAESHGIKESSGKNHSEDITPHRNLNSSKILDFVPPKVPIISNTTESTKTTQSEEDEEVYDGLVTEIKASSGEEKPDLETASPTEFSKPNNTMVQTNVSIEKKYPTPITPNGGWDAIASKTKTSGLTLDKIAKVTNATSIPLPKLPMPTLLIPGGLQPHSRSAGRSTIVKVQSPFTTSAAPLVKGPEAKDAREIGETVTLDPKITKLDEVRESWYFANYNKTMSEPYLGVRANGAEKIVVSVSTVLVLVTGILLL
ncbi:protein artichoke-like [Coccinella septempunctata]|uniref:protein artichoke-like n=1 Tax=Coccinella septempunctata TaxID=41139 RepID=UPI001D08871F|nr:protein artichoke-like [Coccinella septempunctata]